MMLLCVMRVGGSVVGITGTPGNQEAVDWAVGVKRFKSLDACSVLGCLEIRFDESCKVWSLSMSACHDHIHSWLSCEDVFWSESWPINAGLAVTVDTIPTYFRSHGLNNQELVAIALLMQKKHPHPYPHKIPCSHTLCFKRSQHLMQSRCTIVRGLHFILLLSTQMLARSNTFPLGLGRLLDSDTSLPPRCNLSQCHHHWQLQEDYHKQAVWWCKIISSQCPVSAIADLYTSLEPDPCYSSHTWAKTFDQQHRFVLHGSFSKEPLSCSIRRNWKCTDLYNQLAQDEGLLTT